VCTVRAVTDPVTVAEALAQVLSRARPLAGEPVPVEEAPWRVLAEDARAAVDLPRFPSSAMDGYALRAADTPGTLRVVARIAAGSPAPRSLADGEAMGISTGGVVPEGADAVVPIELVTELDDAVLVPDAVASGANVRRLGGDVRAGAAVVPAGTTLSPPRIAALAAAGVSHPRCGARPRVSIVTTGSELRPPGETLADGEIYESNGVMLAAVFRSAGAEVGLRETVSDDPAAHRAALERGLEADVLVTSGGVSVGPHDLVRGTLADLGAEEVFWRVAMRPGKPISFATRGATLVFGLPGNPVSSFVGALLFVVPALRALQGALDPAPRFDVGSLGAPARRNPHRDDFQRARAEASETGTVLVPIEGQDSHMIVRAAAADAIVHVPRGEGELPAGSVVRYLSLGAV
jgi:molybdopterin molybdotransferase